MPVNAPPAKIRVSIGSAVVLGLMKGMLDAEPTTIYLLTYVSGRCLANCAFCPQARDSSGRADMLSRIVWPVFQTEDVIRRVGIAFKSRRIRRVCIQTLNYPNVFEDVTCLVQTIRTYSDIPISVSSQPLKREEMRTLARLGVNRVSIALDAATMELFDKIKGREREGPYLWQVHLETLEEAVKVFGRNSVTTHLIVGLGEKEEDIVRMIQWCVDKGVYPSLFAFTPIRGTAMANRPRPSISSYRRIQLAQYLITNLISRYEDMMFNNESIIDYGVSKRHLQRIIETGEPFRTSGCPGCNRPYYNESPLGPIYNYPKKPRPEDIEKIKKEIRLSD